KLQAGPLYAPPPLVAMAARPPVSTAFVAPNHSPRATYGVAARPGRTRAVSAPAWSAGRWAVTRPAGSTTAEGPVFAASRTGTPVSIARMRAAARWRVGTDRKSTRLNSSHVK